MSGDAAAQTLRESAVRLNHRLRRFAGANALKKIALDVIAEVKEQTGPSKGILQVLLSSLWRAVVASALL